MCSDECHSLLRRLRGQESATKIIKEGRHKGWKSRKIDSYPEKFWIQVLKNNNIVFDRENHENGRYFLDFHILCEDYISISLKELNKFKIGISAIEGMETLKDSLCISEEFFDFYFISRKLRNRLAHRYKLPKDEELLLNLKENLKNIDELERVIENLLKIN